MDQRWIDSAANPPDGERALGFATHQAGSNPLKTGRRLGQQGRSEGIRNSRFFANQKLTIGSVVVVGVEGLGGVPWQNSWGWGFSLFLPFFSFLQRFAWLEPVPLFPFSPLSEKKKTSNR